MSDDLDFPRLVYKKSDSRTAQPVWNLGAFDILTVEDNDEHAAALADGWMLSPADEPAKAKAAKVEADKKPPEAPAES